MVRVKVRYIKETEFLVCTKNKVYEVLDEKTFKHSTWYQIIDDSGEAYWYPAHFFELVA